jgi:hypothetical protein
MRRSLRVGAVCLFLAAITAGAANAGKPVVVEKKATFMRVFAGIPDCLPYGFTTTGRFTITRTTRQFYNRNGTLVREVRHIRFLGSETNDVTGKSLPVNGVRNITLNFVKGTFTETGVLRHVTVPGSGMVLHESGRLVTGLEDERVIFEAGPHQLFHGDVAAFCAALASP